MRMTFEGILFNFYIENIKANIFLILRNAMTDADPTNDMKRGSVTVPIKAS